MLTALGITLGVIIAIGILIAFFIIGFVEVIKLIVGCFKKT